MTIRIQGLRALILVALGAHVAYTQQSAKWRLAEEWRKGGGSEGAYHFDNVHFAQDLAAVPGGRLVVLDRQASRLFLLDSAGAVARAFGGMGSGPGELRSAMGIAVAPSGQILVNDPSNGRFSIYSVGGDYLRAITAISRHPFFFIDSWDGTFDRTGRLRVSVGLHAANGRGQAGNPLFDTGLASERWSADFAKKDSAQVCGAPPHKHQNEAQFYEVQSKRKVALGDAPPAPFVATMAVPFTEQVNAFVRDQDGREWSALKFGSDTLVLRESGRCNAVIARVALRGPRAPIPRAVRDSELVHVPSEFQSRVPRDYAWFHSLHIDDHNRLWVERSVSGGKRFDVFTAGGAAVAELDAPLGLVADLPIIIANDRVYGFIKNDDDVPYLVAWHIVH